MDKCLGAAAPYQCQRERGAKKANEPECDLDGTEPDNVTDDIMR
jgi:hypothetical protein